MTEHDVDPNQPPAWWTQLSQDQPANYEPAVEFALGDTLELDDDITTDFKFRIGTAVGYAKVHNAHFPVGYEDRGDPPFPAAIVGTDDGAIDIWAGNRYHVVPKSGRLA